MAATERSVTIIVGLLDGLRDGGGLRLLHSSRHYTFDWIGNRTQHREGTHTSSGGTAKAYTPNALNQYDAVGSLSPVFDLDGNMTSGPLPVVPGANSALVWFDT